MATILRKVRWTPALEQLVTRMNAIANGAIGYANIANATTNGKLKSQNTTGYRIDGVMYTKAATDNLWDFTGQTTLGASDYKAYRLYLDAAGDPSIEGGTAATTAAAALAALPAPSTSKSVIGVFVAGPSTNFANALSSQGTIYHGTPSGTVGGLDLLTLSNP